MADAFDDEEIAPSADEAKAARVYEMALVFTNRETPMSSTEIGRRFYPGLKPESVGRAFRRDRETLARIGLVLGNVADAASDEGMWVLDRNASLAGAESISAREALIIDVVCRQLVGDASFPYADELAIALAKIDQSFDGVLPGVAPAQPAGSAILREVRRSLESHAALETTYVDAAGRRTDRLLAPYGMFGLRGRTYVVAADLDAEGVPEDGGRTRNFRVDRISSARVRPATPYEIPGDFSVADHVYLPFQLGEPLFEAAFEVPEERERDLRHDVAGKGAWSQDGSTWSADVADVRVAAAWAVGEGIRPLAPKVLVDAWVEVLEGAMRHGD